MRQPFPLDWPPSWARTKNRETSSFSTGLAQTRDRCLNEIRKMGGIQIVITSNMPTRRDGLPYSTGDRGVVDPGVAVYWVGEKREERVIACDRWSRCNDNLHAITLSVAALRGLERWGSSSIVERAFAGFAALPPAPDEPVERAWRAILEIDLNEESISRVREQYRDLVKKAHPDVGGDVIKMQRINQAWEIAQRELGTP